MQNDSDINGQLQRWSARVDQELPEVRMPPTLLDPLPLQKKKANKWLSMYPALAAAVVMIVLSATLFLGTPKPPDVASSSMGDFAEVYSELQRMFPDHTIWFSATDPKVELGISELESTEEGEPIVVRVELQKLGNDGNWSALWSRDILTKETEWVDSRSAEGPGEGLRLWTYSPAPGVWWVETDLDLQASLGLQAGSRLLLTAEHAQSAIGIQTLGEGLRIVNYLQPLPGRSNA